MVCGCGCREKKELDEDMNIAQMNPKDAHAKLLAKARGSSTSFNLCSMDGWMDE